MDDSRLRYRQCTLAPRYSRRLSAFLSNFLFLTLDQRKDILTITRTRTPLIYGSTLYGKLKTLDTTISIPAINEGVYLDYARVTIPFIEYLQQYSSELQSYTDCAVISAYLRICPPCDPRDFEDNLEKCLITELKGRSVS